MPAFTETPRLGPKFARALLYAEREHRFQVRKGRDVPYIGHPLGVAALVIESGGSEDECCGAVLHDVAEDLGGESRLVDIKHLFGDRVESLVRACSDSLDGDPLNKADWRIRKEAHLEKLGCERDDGVLRITVADKLYNTRSIVEDLRTRGLSTWTAFKGGRDGSLWYYKRCASILASARPNWEQAQELYRTVNDLEHIDVLLNGGH